MLFSNQRKHELSVPTLIEKKPSNVASLVHYLCENVMKDPRRNLFVLDGGVWVL